MGFSGMISDLVSGYPISGKRFSVLYRLSGDEREARAKAHNVCWTARRFPDALIPDGVIRDQILGASSGSRPGRTAGMQRR